MRAAILSAVTLCALAPAAALAGPPGDSLTPSGLAGHFTEEACTLVPGSGGAPDTYARRTNVFSSTTSAQALIVRIHGDPSCAVPLLDFVSRGRYDVGRPSGRVAGASEARFLLSSIRITARAPLAAQALNQAGCGTRPWRVGRTQVQGDENCLGIASVAECPVEYSLMRRDGDRLFLGARRGDICTPATRTRGLAGPSVRR